VLATGLTQVVWILSRIRQLAPDANALLEWASFAAQGSGLLLWEAFVSGGAKRGGHAADAEAAMEAFYTAISEGDPRSAVTCSEQVYSLIGAALLRSGWSSNIELLSHPCLVIRAQERTVRLSEPP
ncbi:MAG: hypothetical protein M1587_00585, partial [Thaumarchaeota archaeon]|nr:hypothetical protein [Nitrososphaerota archaeon]